MDERAKAAQEGNHRIEFLARPGVHLLSENLQQLSRNQMPAAAFSSNIGGMSAHWTCACPSPGRGERIPFIAESEQMDAFSKAKALLSVTQDAFPETPESLAIQRILGNFLNDKLPTDRQVQKMPLACKVNERGELYWVGADVILGKLAEPNYKSNFEIHSDTLCRRLNTEGGKITSAVLENLKTKTQEVVKAKIFIVAADAYRTPQLLWASNIRPKALGHYLNEHPFIFTFVALKDALIDKSASAKTYDPSQRKEPTIGVFWVPFDAVHHPHHGQVMHMDVSPIKIATRGNPKHIVGLGWGCLKEMRFEDHIEFSKTAKDWLGMPQMTLKFGYTEQDKKAIADTFRMQKEIAAAFGKTLDEGTQTLMPAGMSLHTQGTVRMGEWNDGTSVCNSYSKVWNYDNLFVGGNGVIPTPLTCNITLSSVAMAVRSAEKMIKDCFAH
ncbi:MAG: hypothetical protein RLZZ628_690 [Bacteroidota bacterium]|jgi:pyranose oxidase